jgi:hypothetical protein
MDQTTHQAGNSPVSRKLGCLAVGCGLPAVMILLVVALVLAYSSSAGRSVDTELQRVRAGGQPISAEELDALYAVPADKTDVTSTLLLVFRLLENPEARQAASKLPITGSSELSIPSPGEAWEQEAAVAQFLNQQEAALDLLHEAAREDAGARFPVDFTAGANALLPHVLSLREATRLLALEAQWKTYHKDDAGAVDALHALFCLATFLEQEPTLVSQGRRWPSATWPAMESVT